MSLTIRGYSDDTVDVSGDVDEEFTHPDYGGGVYVLCSTGDVVRLRLEEEGWRASVIHDATHPHVSTIHERGNADDVVDITGPVAWVATMLNVPARPGGAR